MIAWIGDPFPLTCADVVFFLQLVYTRTLKGLSNLVPCVGCMVGVAMPEKAGEEGTWLPLRDKVIKKLCHACSIADKPPKTSRGDILFIFCRFLEILDLRGVSPADGANLFSSARRRDHRRSVCLSGDARTEEATGGEGRKETHAKSMTAILFPHSYLVFFPSYPSQPTTWLCCGVFGSCSGCFPPVLGRRPRQFARRVDPKVIGGQPEMWGES